MSALTVGMSAVDFESVTVREMSPRAAEQMIVANHYSHSWNTAFGRKNYGIYLGGELLGAAVYGYPMNPKAWPTITSSDPAKCLELNRLWIDDRLGRNAETWFLSRTFRLLRADGYELIQSFADGRLGVGVTYQAANFGYYGATQTMFHATRDGRVLHDTSFTNTATTGLMIGRNWLHATGQTETFVVNTYRYLLPLNRRARKAILLTQLPYPKERKGVEQITDYTPPLAQMARATVMAEVTNDHRHHDLMDYGWRTYGPDEFAREMETQRENPWVQTLILQWEGVVPLFDFEGLGA